MEKNAFKTKEEIADKCSKKGYIYIEEEMGADDACVKPKN